MHSRPGEPPQAASSPEELHYVDYQIHAYVNCAEDMICTGRIERSNLGTAAADGHVGDDRRSWFISRMGCAATIPHAICNNVQNLDVIDKHEFRALRDIGATL